MGNLALDVKHGYRTSMSKTSHANTTVAVVCNPTSNKGKGAEVGGHVIDLLRGAGRKHGFDVIDVTGTSFDDSLANARRRGDEYDYLVAVGGDGMVALGANAVGCSGKPLGIVAIGSGNDFARGLDLPVNRVETAVEGIVGAIVRGTHIDVDMGLVTSLPDGHAIDSTDGTDVSQSRSPINRYYAGMLSCGLDASINDRANHSHLPNGSLRYFAAVDCGVDSHEKLRIPHQGHAGRRFGGGAGYHLATAHRGQFPAYRRRHRGVPVFTVRGRTA